MSETKCVLLVDDEVEVTALLQRRLSHRGYECLFAYCGESALELMQKHVFDVVIMDVKMPGMGGMAALGQVRQHYPQVPVILLSGHADMQAAVEAMQGGAFGYLMKPVDFDELLFKIEDAATQTRLEKNI
ncbi:MAG: response regulator [Desulfovibrionaceae bacterium]